MDLQYLLNEFYNPKYFALITYNQILKTGNKANVIMCPFSLETIFNLTLLGARNETAEEIRSSLSYPKDYQEKIREATSTILTALEGDDSFILKLANKLYLKPGFEIWDDFRNLAIDVFRTDLEVIDFENVTEAAKNINEWVEKQTEDKIHDLMDPAMLNKWTRAILVNALYFKADWLSPPEKGNFVGKFFKNKKETVKVYMMENVHKYKYYKCKKMGVKVLEIPFMGNASMIVALPKKIEGLAAVENKLDCVFSLESHNFVDKIVKLRLPKFKIEANLDFKDILQKVGIEKVFDEEDADLSGIAGEERELYINAIIQKSFIEVDEHGVEAAAASSVETRIPCCAYIPPAAEKEFIVDHPFVFYLKVRGLVVFLGRVTDPTSCESTL